MWEGCSDGGGVRMYKSSELKDTQHVEDSILSALDELSSD